MLVHACRSQDQKPGIEARGGAGKRDGICCNGRGDADPGEDGTCPRNPTSATSTGA